MHKEYILLNGFRKAKKGFTAGFHVPLIQFICLLSVLRWLFDYFRIFLTSHITSFFFESTCSFCFTWQICDNHYSELRKSCYWYVVLFVHEVH